MVKFGTPNTKLICNRFKMENDAASFLSISEKVLDLIAILYSHISRSLKKFSSMKKKY